MKLKKSPRRKLTWRDYPDHLHRIFRSLPSAESCHPDADTVIKAALGVPEARAIADSYACRLPVVTMTAAQMEAL